MIPTITDAQDMAMLRCMTNCTVGGRMTLPSGLEIPPPPAGKVWHVNNGIITEQTKQEKRHDHCHTCKRR